MCVSICLWRVPLWAYALDRLHECEHVWVPQRIYESGWHKYIKGNTHLSCTVFLLGVNIWKDQWECSCWFTSLKVSFIKLCSLSGPVTVCPSGAFLWKCSSRGSTDLTGPTSESPDGCSERDLLWSQHIPGWIRTGGPEQKQDLPHFAVTLKPRRSFPKTSSALPSPINVTLLCLISISGSCESQDPALFPALLAESSSKQAAGGNKQNSSDQTCKLIWKQ